MIINQLPILLNSLESKNVDEWTVDNIGIASAVLMEHAGKSIADHILAKYNSRIINNRVLIFTGVGNNAADGWIAARHLYARGIAVKIISLTDPKKLSGGAKEAYAVFARAYRLCSWNNNRAPWQFVDDVVKVSKIIAQIKPKIIIDAIFGAGLNRDPQGFVAKVIDKINLYKENNKTAIVAVDVPSGIYADGFINKSCAIKADETITFSYYKICHFNEPTYFCCGNVTCYNIGLLLDPKLSKNTYGLPLSLQDKLTRQKKLPATIHKGNKGFVAVLSGSLQASGAARLSCYAALKAGCGKVSLLVNDKKELEKSDNPCFIKNLIEDNTHMDKIINVVDTIVIGPGLLQDKYKIKLAKKIIIASAKHNIPLVIDAEALSFLQKEAAIFGQKQIIIATPHPKEAGLLLDWSTKEVQDKRLAALEALLSLPINKKAKVVWVFKGACPIIGQLNKATVIVQGGVPSLAISGSGDILAGIIAASISQWKDPFDAAVSAVARHLSAGRKLLQRRSTKAALAYDIAKAL